LKLKRRVLSFAGVDSLKLFGQRESHLEILEGRHPGAVVVRGDEIILKGSEDDLHSLTLFFGEIIEIAKKGRVVTEHDFRRLLEGGGDRDELQRYEDGD
jgi:hypothetical protein